MATEVWPDDRALRFGRRERALAQMKAHDLDVLVLGRTANVRYVTGTPTLWLAGTSSFGPACILVRSTGAIHLLSTWDEGIPEDIPRENLFGLTWNPMNTIEVLRRIEGAAGARRVGTDALSPTFARLLPAPFRPPSWSTARWRCGRRAGSRPRRNWPCCARRSRWPRPAWPRRSPSCGPERARKS